MGFHATVLALPARPAREPRRSAASKNVLDRAELKDVRCRGLE